MLKRLEGCFSSAAITAAASFMESGVRATCRSKSDGADSVNGIERVMNQMTTTCCSGSKLCQTSLALIASALTLTISSHSSASITGTYLGYGAHESWGVGFQSSLAWDATSALTLYNLALTERRWVVDGESTITWCVQVYQGVSVGTAYTFDVVEMSLVPQTPPAPGPMGSAKAALLSDAMSRWLGADSRVIASAGSANAAAAGFNALLWEVVNDNFATTDLATIVSRRRSPLDLQRDGGVTRQWRLADNSDGRLAEHYGARSGSCDSSARCRNDAWAERLLARGA